MSAQTPPAKSGRGKIIAIVVIVIVVIAGVAAYYLFLGKGSSTPVSISISGGTGNSNGALSFNPQILAVVVGRNNTITFTNNDNTNHSINFNIVPAGVSNSTIGDSILMAGQSYTVTLTVPGSYQYHCVFHNWMTGMILVKSASPTSGGY
ncbi:MAG: plastocyanin/azurin family copper-binding protein [Thaumarchaeota archaeon]|nr:plastocyanin/azurin family copper-binding protein [Nitrososphaerota archaeon]